MLRVYVFKASLCLTQGLLGLRLASNSIFLPQPWESLDYRSVPIYLAK